MAHKTKEFDKYVKCNKCGFMCIMEILDGTVCPLCGADELNEIKFDMIQVESSNIDFIGYHNEGKSLKVQFKNGTVYQYFEVTPELFNEFKLSESKGSFFSKNIRKDHKFLKVSM